MKTIITVTLFLMYASTSFATGARVDNDLTVNGTLFINGSSLKTTDGLLRDKGVWLPATGILNLVLLWLLEFAYSSAFPFSSQPV